MTEYELPLFEGIPGEHVAWALRFFRLVEVDYGMRIIEEGEEDPTLLCVVDGALHIKTGDLLLGEAGPGDVVGEMALFGAGQRMASVEAVTSTRMLVLDRDGYRQLRGVGSPVAMAIENLALEQLMQRLSDTSDAIAELAEGTPAAVVVPQKGFFAAVQGLFGAGGPRPAGAIDPVHVLRSSGFFRDASDEAIAEIGARMAAQAWSAGSFLCTEGTIGHEMFVLAEGAVQVVISTGGERVEQLATLQPGDAFGMIALLDSRPRMASVVSTAPVTVLVLGLVDWQDLVNVNSQGGSTMRVAMIRTVSDQLSLANAQLAQLELSRQIEGNLERLYRANAHMEAYSKQLTPVEPAPRG